MCMMHTIACISLLAALSMAAGAVSLQVGSPLDRLDRLIPIRGQRDAELIAEYSVDEGKAWHPATLYPGATVDEWRGVPMEAWNKAVLDGRLPAGESVCLWNEFFDVDLPASAVQLRLRPVDGGDAVFAAAVDLSGLDDVRVIDRRNAGALVEGGLQEPWGLVCAEGKAPPRESIHRPIERKKVQDTGYYHYEIADIDAGPVVFKPGLEGWYRVYVGMEPHSTIRFYLSKDDVRYAVPNYYSNSRTADGASLADRGAIGDRLCRDYFICSADLTGQDICITPGGSRFWRDVSVRYVRLVPMTAQEVERFHQVRQLARDKGRQFAGYLEPCTPAFY